MRAREAPRIPISQYDKSTTYLQNRPFTEEIFGVGKLQIARATVRRCCCDPGFSRSSRTPTGDGRTDGQTDRRTTAYAVL